MILFPFFNYLTIYEAAKNGLVDEDMWQCCMCFNTPNYSICLASDVVLCLFVGNFFNTSTSK